MERGISLQELESAKWNTNQGDSLFLHLSLLFLLFMLVLDARQNPLELEAIEELEKQKKMEEVIFFLPSFSFFKFFLFYFFSLTPLPLSQGKP